MSDDADDCEVGSADDETTLTFSEEGERWRSDVENDEVGRCQDAYHVLDGDRISTRKRYSLSPVYSPFSSSSRLYGWLNITVCSVEGVGDQELRVSNNYRIV